MFELKGGVFLGTYLSGVEIDEPGGNDETLTIIHFIVLQQLPSLGNIYMRFTVFKAL
jgi:hypothetical protein